MISVQGLLCTSKCSCCCCVWEKRVKRTSVMFLYNQHRRVGGSSVWRESDTCSITSIGPSQSFVAVITQMGVWKEVGLTLWVIRDCQLAEKKSFTAILITTESFTASSMSSLTGVFSWVCTDKEWCITCIGSLLLWNRMALWRDR